MARKTSEPQTLGEAVETQASAGGLPARIVRLVNPKVLAARRELIDRATADVSTAADRRRRYLETIVDHHLWEELKSA